MATAERIAAEGLTTVARSEWRMAWARLRRNRGAMAGGVILVLMALVAILADVLAREPLNAFDIPGALRPPLSAGHLLGTDDIGRDVFSRIVRGARISLRIGFTAVTIAAVAGTVIGLMAGYFGGWLDMAISRVLDVMLAFPGLLLAIAIVASLGPGLNNAMIALGVAGVPSYARVVRGTTLTARELGYVRAARATGMGDGRIMFRHVLPNVISPILIMATLGLGTSIISAAGLSFLGLGASPPEPEWGLELSLSRNYLRTAWWISTFNGLALAVTVLSINLLGDGLREALDPQASSWSK
ncbi:MAG: ABC transporter permease [Actinobacteria bacterium]|nr:ABC transporter permease [Actinomycetota bacterium]